ncbi:MAG: GlxA family transcriptional regulator [Minwuia sp.]|uniref:GlxA family transcriptional regulator n=1 Tax=Minwuia sp. TaxID=2493630 RepID=UPI003A84D24A
MRVEADRYRTWPSSRAGDEAAARPPVRVAILALPQASMANMAAVYEDLQAVNVLPPGPSGGRRFLPRIVAADIDPRRTISGLGLTPHAALDQDDVYDAVVVPTLYDDGCLSDPDYGPILGNAERDWLRRQHEAGAFMSTMCSGAYGLAEAGLLDGRESAMHGLYAEAFQTRYPRVRVLRKRTLVVSGARREIVTGGQSVYSADVSLFMIAHFHGAPLAIEFATLYGRTWSEALHEWSLATAAEADGGDHVVALAKQFFHMHLADAGLVGAAADLANLNVQTFSRRFQRETGIAPRAYVTGLRMERAMRLLAGSRMPIEDVAARVGYADRSSFAKAFREAVGLPPAEYRTRFQTAARLAATAQA